jgi:hypothetical protein
MLTMLVLAVLAPFTILKDNEGKTLMSFSDLGLPDLKMPDLPSMSSNKFLTSSGGRGEVAVFYQWYDNQGTVQFTTTPPPHGIDYVVKEFNPDTNLIEAVNLPVEKSVSETSAISTAREPSLEIGSPYNPEDVKKLIEDAQSIEKKLQQRFEDQNSALN